MKLLPSYDELKTQFPLTNLQNTFIAKSRQAIRNILNGSDPRLLLIVGPCSIHDSLSAKEFAVQLKKIADDTSDHFLIAMRVYCEKPRTISGWKGFLYDPHLNGSNDIHTGIQWTRQLLLDLAHLQLPAATEFLDPLTAFYYEDLIAWGSIGARTSSSQPHRQLASGLDMPIGIKNGVAGNLSAAVNGVVSALQAHTYVALNNLGSPFVKHTLGNPDAHVVLRGGDSGPNYESHHVQEALRHIQQCGLPSRLIIDCSHQNSGKRYDKQPLVYRSVLDQIKKGNKSIRGLMLESHLFSGNQSLVNGAAQLNYGISVTDGCLDLKSTQELIMQSIFKPAATHISGSHADRTLSCATL